MPLDFGVTPDPPALVHKHVLRLIPEVDRDMVHLHFLPDGYNCHQDGLAIVVSSDVQDVDDSAHSRDLVKVSVYGPDHMMVRHYGRILYTALTQGMTGIGLGVSRSDSKFFGSGPSYQPTGFVSTMSLSVGIGKLFFQSPARTN
ncbi:hypothetical protein ACUY3C_07720 [Corynebacterium marquesiae]